VQPGFMKPLLPDEAPQYPETWQNIMNDIERVIMPGVSN
jgi:aromatic-L-amino-acid decarboxylase